MLIILRTMFIGSYNSIGCLVCLTHYMTGMYCIFSQFSVLDLIYSGKITSVEGESLIIKLSPRVRNLFVGLFYILSE